MPPPHRSPPRSPRRRRAPRRSPRRLALAVCCGAAAALVAPAALAGALGSRHGQVRLEDLRLSAHVEDGLATTELEQVLRNDAGLADEAVYDLPLPERATFAGLSVWVDGHEVKGEVVSRARAEEIYEDVTGAQVAAARDQRRQAPALAGAAHAAAGRPQVELLAPLRLRDPGLLELLDGRTLRLRLAPVPAGGTYRVKVRWVAPTVVQAGRGRLVVPLAPPVGSITAARGRVEGGEAAPGAALAERLRASLLVSSSLLGPVACPSHAEATVDVLAEGLAAQVELDLDRARLDRDLEVDWAAPPASAPTLSVAAARDGDGPGTALLSLTPWFAPDAARGPRDVVVALDASPGVGARAAAARAALERLLSGLDPDDRLAVMVVDLAARTWPPALAPATPENRAAALAFFSRAAWRHPADPRAALAALARLRARSPGPARPLELILVTDAGLSRDDALLRALEAPALAAGVRVSALELGAGGAVRAPLGRLARVTGGFALPAGVAPDLTTPGLALAAAGEQARARRAAGDLEALLAAPALFSPHLTLEGVELSAVHPARPPAVLTAGTQVHLLGRYARPGAGRLLLEGTLASGRRARWVLPLELPARGRHPDVARLWAQAAADAVEADLQRPGLPAGARAALARDLERVSLAGPILTRATALLVLEGEGMFRAYGIDRRNRDLVGQEEAAQRERLDDLQRRLELRRREALEARRLTATAPPPRQVELWKTGGLGGGGGAGEPLLLLLAAAAGAGALRRRRAA